MDINFFDDPFKAPRSREDVRIKKLGFFVHEDKRRVAVGFDVTPFLERPSIEVTITNANGDVAGALTVIETLEANFTLTMHLRDRSPTEQYDVEAVVYYAKPEEERVDVHTYTASFPLQPGEYMGPETELETKD